MGFGTAVVDRLILNMELKSQGGGKLVSELDKVEATTKTATAGMDKMSGMLDKIGQAGTLSAQGFDTSKTTAQLRTLSAQMGITGKNFEQAFKRGERAAGRFDMRLLSLLFGGMALKRAFGGVLRSVRNSFTKAEGNTSALAQATTRLGGAWEFFKFSLMDALNTPFFIGMIDGIIGLINWFSQLPGGVKVAILGVSAALATLGTGAMVYAQITLAWNSLFGLGGILTKSAAVTAAKVLTVDTALKTTAATASGITFGGIIIALGGIAAAAAVAWLALNKMKELTDEYIDLDAPSVTDIALGKVDNLEVLSTGAGTALAEFSDLNKGMDRTIELQNNLDTSTGDVTTSIVTQDEKIAGIIETGEEWLTSQKDLNTQLGEDINQVASYIETLNNIPREITTVIRTIREDGGSSFDGGLRNQSSVSNRGD